MEQKESRSDQNNNFPETQTILSIGYVYLIVLGLFNESIYYNFIGINIIKYSSILDILISPISRLTENIIGIIIFIVLIICIFILPTYLAKRKDKNWFKKTFKLPQNLDEEETKNSLFYALGLLLAMGLLGFFFGTGIGSGIRTSRNIKNKEIKYHDEIKFLNNQIDSVFILGVNSSYLFYLTPESDQPNISPINSVIMTIKEHQD